MPSSDDKPVGASLGWQRLETSRPYQSRWHNLRQDRIRLPSGEEITYTYQEHPGFVAVVPVTPDGQVVLIRSYRYTVDDWCLELPAGGTGDKMGASLLDIARQELVEETGGIPQVLEQVGWFYTMNGTSSARCTVFLARGVVLSEPTQLEPTEKSDVVLIPVAQALQMARDGRITDGDSALALLRCEAHLMGKHRAIEVVPYDPQWPRLFQVEAARLAAVFGEELVAVRHMGSTAVPGMWAKPVIDIMPIVSDIERIDSYNDLMVSLGYLPKGEYGIPGRRFFNLDSGNRRLFNVHVYQIGNPEIPRHLDFIEYLQVHPEDAAAYAELKRSLADRFSDDIDSYVTGKTDLVREIEQKVARWKHE